MISAVYTDMQLRAIRRWPSTRARMWVENYLKTVADDPLIRAVIAVGSAVRPNVRSVDLDLVTIAWEPVKPWQRPPVEVDVRIFASEDLEARIQGGHDYLGWAVLFGAVLHEKDRYWSTLACRVRGRVPLPSAVTARTRAARVYKNVQFILQIGDEDAGLEQIVSLLTHLARAELIDAGVYPASRPELPKQLLDIGHVTLANLLHTALQEETSPFEIWNELLPKLQFKKLDGQWGLVLSATGR